MKKPKCNVLVPGQSIEAPFHQQVKARAVVDLPDGLQLAAGWPDSFRLKLQNPPVISAAALKADMEALQREVFEPMRAKQFQNSQKPFQNRRKP